MGSPLTTTLRDQLRKTIATARREGEAGAKRALEALAVGRPKPHDSMTPGERELRNRLRAHGRQLGDARDKNTGEQATERLVHEVAYEHWHRMLFARFLAENGLLIEPEYGVAITLDECEELAREQGEDPHAMAARFAQEALPQIFRVGDPVLEVQLAPETRQSLERLLDGLPREVFTADDSLGWTYQFWQAEKKEEVNASGVKIGADELPPVTQLFTEHYMVQFLFHNTIGAWHAGKVLEHHPDLAETASSEEELRRAVRLRSQGGYDFAYLRFVRETREGDEEDHPTGPWRPAAGAFEGWPQEARELTVLDPCCGSGHFLVEGFELLVRLRMDEEGLALEDATRAVLADNLHGLEIDQRCTQIAAFNLALAAWRLAGSPIRLPPLNVACSGLAPNASKDEWLDLAEEAAAAGGMPASRDLYGIDESLLSARLKGDLAELYELFEQAPALGSLIDPRARFGEMFQGNFDALHELLRSALEAEARSGEAAERAVAAQGMAKAADLLARRFTIVLTNVPFLTRSKQGDTLREFSETNHTAAKAELATCMLERCLVFAGRIGAAAIVTPHNWQFLTTYRKLRERLLEDHTWLLVVHLGPAAFRDMNWWAAKTALSVLATTPPGDDARISGLDLDEHRVTAEKPRLIRSTEPVAVVQHDQLRNPDARVVLGSMSRKPTMEAVATSLQGIATADYSRFGRSFWEGGVDGERWILQQSTVPETSLFGGRENVLLWEGGEGELARSPTAYLRGLEAWGTAGVAISQMRHLPATLFTGEAWDNNVAVIVPHTPEHLSAIWAYCSSPEYLAEVRKIDRKSNVTNATLAKVPFDLAHWQKVAAEKYPDGLPEPQSDDPTQWLFHGHPAKAELATILQVAVARLLGYRWPPEHDPEMRLADEARAWVDRCPELGRFADRDGVVCLSPLHGERSAADRLRALLAAAFGAEWSGSKERELLAAAAGGDTPAERLEDWLRDRFFEGHCKLFHHRPFIWHLWDGRADGFHCLVNAHRLTGPEGEGRRTLESLAYSYLGDWIERQRAEQREGREGADGRLAAALDLQGQLERILEGEPPYDLFVRWKPLHQQAIGWQPDVDDGIRLNIRPFMAADLRKGGRKGAGILRWKPNIKWTKDRGKEPESLRPKAGFPWFWTCPGNGTPEERTDFMGGDAFDGNRWNDLHYTNATKRAARERASTEGSDR